MKKQNEITPEMLRHLLTYEPETGKLFWRERTPEMFKDGKHSSGHTCAKWNSKLAGKEAFTALNAGGYAHGAIWGSKITAHWAAWAIINGRLPQWPSEQIDHINGVRSDNRLKNLRVVSQSENAKNVKLRIDSTSGVCGVHWHKKAKKWSSCITVDGVRNHLGLFETMEEAAQSRKIAEARAGFHPNHGRDF